MAMGASGVGRGGQMRAEQNWQNEELSVCVFPSIT